jgi:drug/metabolite transporter (DMT)-like permease
MVLKRLSDRIRDYLFIIIWALIVGAFMKNRLRDPVEDGIIAAIIFALLFLCSYEIGRYLAETPDTEADAEQSVRVRLWIAGGAFLFGILLIAPTLEQQNPGFQGILGFAIALFSLFFVMYTAARFRWEIRNAEND